MSRALAACVAGLLVLAVKSANASPRSAAQEATIERAVAAVDGALVATLHAGNDAIDRGDVERAVIAYATVHERAPAVAAVTRRLCTAEVRANKQPQGITHCREALAAEGSAENHAALAGALLSQPGERDDVAEAMREARAATRLAPDAEFAQTILCEAAIVSENGAALDECSAKLREIAPSAPSTHVFTATALAVADDLDGAQRELDAARALGLDAKTADAMQARLDARRPRLQSVKVALVAIVVTWIFGAFVLFVLGMGLGDSSAKLAARGESPAGVTRALYRCVLVIASAWFYFSAALIALTTLAASLGVVAEFLELAHASRVVRIGVAAVVLYIVVAAIRALFARAEIVADETLDAKREARLAKIVDAIAVAVDAVHVDAIAVRPDAIIDVERRGKKRVLVVGVAALRDLSRRAFEAIVARAIRAAGPVRTRRDALSSLADRATSPPVRWFVKMFRAFFFRISDGAWLQEEMVADREAARAFGSVALLEGLEHVERRSDAIDEIARASLRDLIDGDTRKKPIENFYDRALGDEPAIDLGASRVKQIEAIDAAGREPASEGDAWDLFSDRSALEAAMTARVKSELAERAGFKS